jgi:2',3'-cyclic-nucleotide 2'-phosphodiesterase (5'-nucleotidase family)
MIGSSAAIALFLFPTVYAQTDTLTVLHLNDSHSHLLPYGPKDADGNWTWGGYARIATLVGMSRMTEPNVMLLHGGDFFVGDFMFQEYVGVAELEIMKALYFDALALGNHEFDLYPSTLKYVLNQAGFPAQGFPILCANLELSGDMEPPPLSYFVSPYTIKDISGIRVGIFGLMTDLANQISNPSPIVVTPPLNVAQAWVDTLRVGHNCEVVILLSHLGIDYEHMVAATVSGIDVIVGGHSHTVVASPIQIGNTLLLQAGEFGRYLGKLHLFVADGAVGGWDYELMPVDSSVPEEPTLAGMIGQLAAGIEADPRFGPVYTNVIAHANGELNKPLGVGLLKDTPLGNLAADACRTLTGTDIAFQPQGFISQTIYGGDIKGADVFQAFPYGFDPVTGLGLKLVTFRTDGMSIMAGLEFAVYNMPYVEDFLLHTSNLAYVYDLSVTPGARIDYSSITVGGQPIDPVGSYTVTAPDAVVPFLYQIPGFNIGDLVMTDYSIYNVVKDFVVARSPVAYYSEGRVIDVSLMGDPIVGAGALADVVSALRQNGSITSELAAAKLRDKLRWVEYSLQRGQVHAAWRQMMVFRSRVEIMGGMGVISPFSTQKLLYLADALMAAIGSPFALQPGDNAGVPIPGGFALEQNYPNPFNPQTQIAYSIPLDSDVRLTIYNILGETVRVLVDGYQSAGVHDVTWDGHNQQGGPVASGTYFYRIQAGDFSETKKMCLMR